MKGAFLSTSTSRIAAPFSCKSKGGLNKRFYLPETLQSYSSSVICHQRTCHKNKYIYSPIMSRKTCASRKNIFDLAD